MPRFIPEATDQQISRYSAKIGSNGGEMALDPPMQDSTAAQWNAILSTQKRRWLTRLERSCVMISSEPQDEFLSVDPTPNMQLDDEIFPSEITYGQLQKKLWAAHVRTTIQSLFAVFQYYVPTMSRDDVGKFMAREQKD